MRKLIFIALCAVTSVVQAQNSRTIDYDQVRRNHPMPSDEQIRQALETSRAERERALAAPPAKPRDLPAPAVSQTIPDVRTKGVRIENLPSSINLSTQSGKPAKIDIGDIADAYDKISRPVIGGKEFELLVFLSTSIPGRDLKNLIEAAADAQATVVFRGPADERDTLLQRFAAKLRSLDIKRAGEIIIDPPAYGRYKIERVPAYVLAHREDSLREVNGCAPVAAYASVSGVISPEYALNVIKSRAPDRLANAAGERIEALRHKQRGERE